MLIGAHSERLTAVRDRIARAARRAGRDPGAIHLIAVSKAQPVEAIEAVRALGVRDFGESYVQEGLAKITALAPPRPRWHFVGHLQSNKSRPVAEHFDWVHGVDRVAIARRLSAQRPIHAPPLMVCLQVRLGEEPTKGGVTPQELPALAAGVAGLERLRLRGLMCIPPPSDDPVRQRQWFRQLRELLEALNHAGYGLDTLSMGMSGDFEVAIEEGATQVRIGTAIFGERRS